MKDVTSLLAKLDTALGKNRGKNKVDYKELKELKEKSVLKLKEGKNNIVFITPEGAEDPFSFWGYHAGLQEVAFYSVPCDNFNKNTECTVCKVIEDLKSEDYEGNKHIWYPIRQQTEYWAPVVDVSSADTIAQGAKWLRLSKTVMSQLTEWLRNLEKDEAPFYSDEDPTKIIVSYDKKAAPMEQYKLDKKSFKSFSDQQLADWRGTLKPIGDFIISKSQTEISKIVDSYFERIQNEIASASSDEQERNDDSAANSKLSAYKKA